FSDSFDRGRHNLRPTLGVHLVFDAARLPHQGRALVLRTPQDNRLFFMLPAGARTIVGTTDTDWSPGNGQARGPRVGDEIRAGAADVRYLLDAVNHALPAAGVGPDDVISTFAGLRPLVAAPAHTPSETSREHEIVREPDGLLTVAGGKLTTLRRMAEQAVDRVADLLHTGGREAPAGPSLTGLRPRPCARAAPPRGRARPPPPPPRTGGPPRGGGAWSPPRPPAGPTCPPPPRPPPPPPAASIPSCRTSGPKSCTPSATNTRWTCAT